MKKLLGVFLLVLFSIIYPTSVEAKVIVKESGVYTVEKDEIIDDDLFIGAESVEILGKVNGDVYVGAASFIMSGDITGDLFVGAGTANISGTIGDDLRIGSGNISISKTKIGDGLSIGGGSVVIDDETFVGGSFLAGAGTINSKASVSRNMMVGGGSVIINGPVGGEVRVGGEKISLGSKAVIDGDFTYEVGETDVDFADGATVSGLIKRNKSNFVDFDKDKFNTRSKNSFRAINSGLQGFSFLGALMIGLVALKFLYKPSIAVVKVMEKNFLNSVGTGLLVFILAGPFFVILMMTVIGIPLAGILLPLYLIDLCIAKLVTSLYLGRYATDYLGKKKVSVYAAFTLGLMLYYLLRLVPVVRVVVRIGALLAGLGAIYTASWKWIVKQRK